MMGAPAAVRVETLVDDAATRRPNHPALIFGDRCWTYAALQEEMNRRAAMLVQAGLLPGDIVATTEPPTDDLAISFLACCRANLTLLFLSPHLTIAEAAPLLAHARPQAALTADGQRHPARAMLPSLPLALPGVANEDAAREAARRSVVGSSEATAAILATSGTTGGRTKLVRVPHREQTWRREMPEWWETADSVFYVPRRNIMHPRDLCAALMVGGTTALSRSIDPEQIEREMVAYRATILWTVPPLLRLLVDRAHPPAAELALQAVRIGSATLPTAVARAAAHRYGATVVEAYGSTEGGLAIRTPRGGAPEGSIGIPYPGVAVRIVDEAGVDVVEGDGGHLLIRSPGLMRGYLDDPAATAQMLRDGWLWTGDMVRRDADGFYYLEGRRALRINVGGFKVAPEEVEAVLAAHPGVREAVVLAMPDAARGEVVRAVIVPEGVPPSIGELRRYCRERLAGYKVPRHFEFRDELPRSPLGKVLRHLL